MDIETLKAELLAMPAKIKQRSLLICEKSEALNNEKRKRDIIEIEAAYAVASNDGLTNETKRKAERLRILNGNDDHIKLQASIPSLEHDIKVGEIDLRYLQDQFSALRTLAGLFPQTHQVLDQPRPTEEVP